VNEVNDEKHCDLVKKIVRVWREVVESSMEDSYASALLKFKEVRKTFPLIEYAKQSSLNMLTNPLIDF